MSGLPSTCCVLVRLIAILPISNCKRLKGNGTRVHQQLFLSSGFKYSVKRQFWIQVWAEWAPAKVSDGYQSERTVVLLNQSGAKQKVTNRELTYRSDFTRQEPVSCFCFVYWLAHCLYYLRRDWPLRCHNFSFGFIKAMGKLLQTLQEKLSGSFNLKRIFHTAKKISDISYNSKKRGWKKINRPPQYLSDWNNFPIPECTLIAFTDRTFHCSSPPLPVSERLQF